jgi:hypothetical protein
MCQAFWNEWVAKFSSENVSEIVQLFEIKSFLMVLT